MQAEKSKDWFIEIEQCSKKIVDCFVNGLYGEKYRKRIERIISNINFVVVASNQTVIEFLRNEKLGAIMGDVEEKLEIFQKAENNRKNLLQDEEDRFNSIVTECIEKIFDYCKNNDCVVNSDTEFFLKNGFKNCDTRSGELDLKNSVASMLGMFDCKLSYFKEEKEKEEKIENTELWKLIESMDMVSKLEEKINNLSQINKQNEIMVKINREFIKQKNLISEDVMLSYCENMPAYVSAMAESIITKDGKPVNMVLIPLANVIDQVLIHEIIHIVEWNIFDVDLINQTYSSEVGFLRQKLSTNTMPIYDSKEEEAEQHYYEALNEAITDYFAVKISNHMRRNNIEILRDVDFNSAYSTCFPYCGDLFELMLDDLIKYRTTKNAKKFYKLFGKEKMDEFAKTVEYFMYGIECGRNTDDATRLINKEFNTNYTSFESVVQNLDKFGKTDFPLVVNLRKIEELKQHYINVKQQEINKISTENVDDVIGV